jgi:hypothetical protein
VAVAVEGEDENEGEGALGCDDGEDDGCGDIDVKDVDPDAFPAFTDSPVSFLLAAIVASSSRSTRSRSFRGSR